MDLWYVTWKLFIKKYKICTVKNFKTYCKYLAGFKNWPKTAKKCSKNDANLHKNIVKYDKRFLQDKTNKIKKQICQQFEIFRKVRPKKLTKNFF